MTAWGTYPMDNECAGDLVLILAQHVDDPIGYARKVLEDVLSADPVDTMKGEFAIAVATVLSALSSGPDQAEQPFYDDEQYQAGVLTLVPVAQDPDLRRLAVAAIDRIFEPRSHLPEWWEETDPDGYEEWKDGVREVQRTLGR